MEQGQWEAAHALGLTRWQQLRYVILPQALRRILPALGGQLISTIKDSAIVSVISIPERTFQGLELMSATYLTFEVWITITALYFVLTFTCSLGVRRLYKGLAAMSNHGDARRHRGNFGGKLHHIRAYSKMKGDKVMTLINISKTRQVWESLPRRIGTDSSMRQCTHAPMSSTRRTSP